MTRNNRNKISTPGYFLKRLRDNNFISNRIFSSYADSDPRRWTVLVEPGTFSIYITCFENKNFANEVMYEFNDGDRLFRRNLFIKTESIEVIITHLLSKGVIPSGNRKADTSPHTIPNDSIIISE
jgi:hypothetical protein